MDRTSQKQGDKLSPLLFGLIFNALLLALKATNIGHRTITGLRTPSRGFADDLTLVTCSAADMSRLLRVVSNFCEWSGMRVKLQKSVITAFDFGARCELPTDTILYQGQPLVRLAADQSFPYLGVRASLVQSKTRCTSSPGLRSEKDHIFSATQELVGTARGHKYLLGQMVPTMRAVAASRFRYSAPLVLWTDAELQQLYRVWLQVERSAWRLPPGFPSAPLTLPSDHGGCPLAHPRVLLIQALSKHIEQLVALPDDLRQDTIERYKRLCASCGCHNARELSAHLAQERRPRRCPIARLLRACGQLGVEARLPVCLSIWKTERETSWHCLLAHLRRVTSAPGADERLASDMACVASAWCAIRRRLARRGIRQPRQLLLDPHGRPVVWLVPETLSPPPYWLESFRRVLSLVDAAALFPRLDRGDGVPETAPHQTLIHEVLSGLLRPDCHAPALFSDERWNLIRCTAPHWVWQQLLSTHGLLSSSEATGSMDWQTVPIVELVELGHCPDMPLSCLRSLVLGLAPHLRTANMRVEQADGGPLMWDPVVLSTERVEWCFEDETAGTDTVGGYTIRTKDGLVRIVEGVRHIATVNQGRWRLLAGAYDDSGVGEEAQREYVESVCAALPGWVAQVEKDEASRGVASAQFWHGVRVIVDAECVVGCNPLVAPSSFPVAVRCWGMLEGWGYSSASHPSRVMYCMLTQSPAEQLQMAQSLKAGAIWWALTRASNLAPEVRAMLSKRGHVLAVFKRGTRAAACKGSWRLAKLQTCKTKENWTLWASSGAAGSAQKRAELKSRLDSMRLTEDGVMSLDLDDPSAREAALGPAGAAYRHKGVTVGTDGACKSDGAMGAAFISKNCRLQAKSVAVHGSPSSSRPELTAIGLACEDSPIDEDLTILTDSLSSMNLLKSTQRKDFPLWLYRHAERQLLTHVVSLINRRAAAGVITRFVKVKAHRAEPLNEAADAMASAAAELDPSRPLDLDPEAVYFYRESTLVGWDSRLRDHLTQVAARQGVALIGKEMKRKDGSVTPAHVPWSAAWLLRRDQGRSTLGEVLRSMKTSANKSRILQSLASTYPCNAILFKWGRLPSPACMLCGGDNESLSHVQCICPALQDARIRAHHNLVTLLWDRLGQASPQWAIHREMSIASLLGMEAPLDCRDEWQRAMDDMSDLDLDADGDPALAAGLLRKRPDGLAINWGRKTVLILEFTRAFDSRADWHILVDQHKTERYTSLRNRLQVCLGSGWSVEIMPFSLGIRGSYAEGPWTAALSRFGLHGSKAADLLTELVSRCLDELNELFSVRTAAILSRNAKRG